MFNSTLVLAIRHVCRIGKWIVTLVFALSFNAALAGDTPMPDSDKNTESSGAPTSLKALNSMPCIELHKGTGAFITIGIYKPGHYCLADDMHPRLDLPDHPAESVMIQIWTSNVVLDLQGHTLGRGRLFKNPGGAGITINDQYQLWKWIANSKNIVIKNGVLQDFGVGIIAGSGGNPTDLPSIDHKAKTYHFPANNLTLENITFKNNKKDFAVFLPWTP